MSVNSIEQEALGLDLKGRARLASILLRSLDDISEEECEKLWAEEASSRLSEMDRGQVAGVPFEKAVSEARELIG